MPYYRRKLVAKKFVAPDLSNATPTMLLDEMGKLSIMENQIKKLRAVYKQAYYARQGIDVDQFANGQEVAYQGEVFVATTTRSDPVRIDSTELKEKYPEVAAECSHSNPQLTTRFALKEGVVNPIVNDLLEQMKKELDLD